MNLTALTVAGALVLTSCVSSAGAGESEPLPVQAPSSTTVKPVEGRAVIVYAGQVQYTDDAGAYHIRILWNQEIDHPDFELMAPARVDLAIVPRTAAGLVGQDGTDRPDATFEVTGEVRYLREPMLCESKWVASDCAVVSLIDASLRGSATLKDSVLNITVRWVTFGRDNMAGRAALAVGRWPSAGVFSKSSAVVELTELSDALEAAGVIGRGFSVGVHRPRQRQLVGDSTFGSGQGVLEVLATP